jgi:hypothetical protein
MVAETNISYWNGPGLYNTFYVEWTTLMQEFA